MRKYLLCLFIVSFLSGSSFGQAGIFNSDLFGLYDFSKSYFRSDPFFGEFSGFLKHLINDPDIENKIIRKRTDTSLYLFSGTYKSYNPFFFKPKRVEIYLSETPVQYEDSLNTMDTVFVYQLRAYADNDEKNTKEIKKEFNRIHRQTIKKFYDAKYYEEKKGDTVTSAIHHYFVALHQLSPLSITLLKLESTNEMVLAITLRMKMSSNQAILPGSLFGQ